MRWGHCFGSPWIWQVRVAVSVFPNSQENTSHYFYQRWRLLRPMWKWGALPVLHLLFRHWHMPPDVRLWKPVYWGLWFIMCNRIEGRVCRLLSTRYVNTTHKIIILWKHYPGSTGNCLGAYVGNSLALTENLCLLKCQESDQCKWYSYSSSDYDCILMSDCAFVDNTCNDCVYGQGICKALPGKVWVTLQ